MEFPKYQEQYYGGRLSVPGQLVGAHLWTSLVEETQKDRIERGFVVSQEHSALLTSRIFLGKKSETIYDGSEVRTTGGSFSPPLFPQGLKSLLPTVKDVVLVHSHFVPDQLPTTVFSDADIAGFFHSNYSAVVCVDRGGAHLLIRTHKAFPNVFPEKQLVRNLVLEIAKNNGGIIDVIAQASKQVERYGLAYLYTQKLVPEPNGAVFFDACH